MWRYPSRFKATHQGVATLISAGSALAELFHALDFKIEHLDCIYVCDVHEWALLARSE
jgi:hypothetical protein